MGTGVEVRVSVPPESAAIEKTEQTHKVLDLSAFDIHMEMRL
jgi:hypothetical protein